MNLSRVTQIEEIAKAVALQGMDRASIVAKYVKEWQTSARTIDRILKSAGSRVLELQQELKSDKPDTAIDEQIAAKKELLLTAIDKRLLLRRIMTGEHQNEVKRAVFNPGTGKFEIITIMERPDDRAIISAIAEDNKMVGDYAPVKKDLKHSGKIETESDKEALREIAEMMRSNAAK